MASPRPVAELLALLLLAGAAAMVFTRMGSMVGERAAALTRRIV